MATSGAGAQTKGSRMYRLRDERGVFSDIWASGLMRRAALGAGRRLATSGRIQDPEHIVDATADEMAQMVMSSSQGAPWVAAVGDGVGSVPGTADFRGVATHVVVQVRSDGPLGILGYSQTRSVSLRPLYIGPRPVAPEPAVDLTSTDIAPRASAMPIDDVPSVIREYQPGDPWRQISWPATARAGRLMTRDFELGTERDLLLVVDLGPTPGPAAEHAAAVAAWVGSHALARGWRLDLTVRGPRGELSGPVDAVGLHCNLALAQCGDVPRPADHRCLLVTPSGVEWR